MAQTQNIEDTFTTWRRSYKRLRVLEGELVIRSRSGDDPAVIARMYDKVEALREQTSMLFQAAQITAMTYETPLARLTSLTLVPTLSEFGTLHGA